MTVAAGMWWLVLNVSLEQQRCCAAPLAFVSDIIPHGFFIMERRDKTQRCLLACVMLVLLRQRTPICCGVTVCSSVRSILSRELYHMIVVRSVTHRQNDRTKFKKASKQVKLGRWVVVFWIASSLISPALKQTNKIENHALTHSRTQSQASKQTKPQKS